jgi:hypothetical protein
MKKNYFYGIMVIIMAAMMGVSFVSCGDDDDKGNSTVVPPAATTTSLVGSWKHMDKNGLGGYELMVFQANGTGVLYDYDYDENTGTVRLDETEAFSYTFNESTKILTCRYAGGDIETEPVVFISATQIRIGDDLYTKQQ